MKKDNINTLRFYKARKVAEELCDFAVDNKELSDMDDFKSFIEGNSCSEELVERLRSTERANMIQNELKNRDKVGDISNFSRKVKKAKKDRVRIGRIKLTASITVAAAVLFLTFNIYDNWHLGNNYIITPKLQENYLQPTLLVNNIVEIKLDDSDKTMNLDEVIESNIKNTKNLLSSELLAEDKITENRLIVPKGYTYPVTLPDGTEVILNAGSELTYPSKFSDSSRVVELKGEAYFNVKKSSTIFKVNVNDISINVYGTEFNVKSGFDNTIETVLKSGSVGVKGNTGDEYKLKPNQKLTYSKGNDVKIEEVNVDHYLSWNDGQFIFVERSLGSVFYDLSNWYGVNFTMPETLKDMKITAVFNNSSELLSINNFIEDMLKIKIINHGEGVYVIEEK